MVIFFLSLRNVLLQWKRYLLMFIAISFGFTLVVLVNSITSGAIETVKTKAARYFSGHLSVTGYIRHKQYISDPLVLINLLEQSELPIRTVSSRTIYYRQDTSLFFAGESIRQRRLIGIDFNREGEELEQLEFLDGNWEEMLNEDAGILISEAASGLLGARVGDNVMISLTTDTGQFNTANLLVKGIFRETSLFGYVAYMNQNYLNSLLLFNEGEATDIALYAEKGTDISKLMDNVRELFSEDFVLLPVMETKADLNRELGERENINVPVLAPLTLEAHLAQITSIMDAINIVTMFIQVLFMVIIMVGILNTYRVLVFERTKEIGTLRAMGLTRTEVRSIFLTEALILDLISSVFGFFTFYIIVKLIGYLNLSGIPGAGLFTERGYLFPHINGLSVVYAFVFILIAVLLAAWRPAERASRMSPVDAMREEN